MKPTIASLTAQLAQAKEEMNKWTGVISGLKYDLHEANEQIGPLRLKLKNTENILTDTQSDLNKTRAELRFVIARLRDRISFIRTVREIRTNFATAQAVGAPEEVIEKLRIKLHDSCVDLVLADLSETGVDDIADRNDARRSMGDCVDGSMAFTAMQSPVRQPYGV